MEKHCPDGEENKKMAKYCTTGIVTNYRIGEGIIEINSDLKHNGKNIWIEVDDKSKEKPQAVLLDKNQKIILKGGSKYRFQSALQTALVDGATLKFYIEEKSFNYHPLLLPEKEVAVKTGCCRCIELIIQMVEFDRLILKSFVDEKAFAKDLVDKNQLGNKFDICCCQKCCQTEDDHKYVLYDVEIISK